MEEMGDDGGMTSTRERSRQKYKRRGSRNSCGAKSSRRSAVAFSLHLTQSCAHANACREKVSVRIFHLHVIQNVPAKQGIEI